MAVWTTELVLELRWMIGDEAAPYTYSDASLQTVIAIAAKKVVAEVDLAIDYTVDVGTPSISPDPSSDLDASNLFTLKAACILDNNNARSSAGGDGIAISDDGSSLDTRGRLSARLALLAKGYCQAYEDAKFAYIMEDRTPGKLITTPAKVYGRSGINNRYGRC